MSKSEHCNSSVKLFNSRDVSLQKLAIVSSLILLKISVSLVKPLNSGSVSIDDSDDNVRPKLQGIEDELENN